MYFIIKNMLLKINIRVIYINIYILGYPIKEVMGYISYVTLLK